MKALPNAAHHLFARFRELRYVRAKRGNNGLNDLCNLARDLRDTRDHSLRYALVDVRSFGYELLMLCRECGNNALRDLRYFLRDLHDTRHHAGSYVLVEVLSGLIETLSLRRQSGNNPLDDRVHRSGQAFNVRDNAVVHGVYCFRRRQRARSAHCGGHIAFNAAHVVGEAYAHAVRHVAADFSEYR